MRLYETVTIWAHGSRFVVRRVPTTVRTPGRHEFVYDYSGGRQVFAGYRDTHGSVIDRLPPYTLHGPNGEFARLHYRQLRRWINYYALTALREQRTT